MTRDELTAFMRSFPLLALNMLLGCNALAGIEEPDPWGPDRAPADATGQDDVPSDAPFMKADRSEDAWVDAPRVETGPDQGNPNGDAGAAGDVVPDDVKAADVVAADGVAPDVMASDVVARDVLAADVDASRCTPTGGCTNGFNCWQGACVPALVSCAAQKSTYPTSTDGVYFINPAGQPMRAYCDMQEVTELCTEIEGDHRGKTREGSGLIFTLRSILHAGEDECLIWALRSSTDGYALTRLNQILGQTLTTCQALGFVADGALGDCPFGDDPGLTGCGFQSAPPYFLWGNLCAGCSENDGMHKTYVRQGPIHTGGVLSSISGSTQTRCKVR